METQNERKSEELDIEEAIRWIRDEIKIRGLDWASYETELALIQIARMITFDLYAVRTIEAKIKADPIEQDCQLVRRLRHDARIS